MGINIQFIEKKVEEISDRLPIKIAAQSRCCFEEYCRQRWSPRGRPWPRGHILKSLASKPEVLKNCPVLGSRTAQFFEQLKFC